MKMIEHHIDLVGPGCHGRYARPELVAAVLGQVKPTVMQTVRMSVLHTSRRVGRPLKGLRAVWDVQFGGQKAGPDDSTRLLFKAPALKDAAPQLFEQYKLWERDGPSGDETAFDLVGEVLADIRQQRKESEHFDADLLSRVSRFDTALNRGLERLTLAGHHLTGDRVQVIDEQLTRAARTMAAETPPPRQVRVAGKLDMIRVSDRVFELLLREGERLRGVWTQPTVTPLAEYLGRRVVIAGAAVFRPSGAVLRIETSAIAPATEHDAFFSKLPTPGDASGRPERLRVPQTATTGVNAIWGEWPGDDSEEDLLKAVQEMS